MPLANRRAKKTIAIVFQIRLQLVRAKSSFQSPRQNLIGIVTLNPLHDDLPYMEVRRAMFLRACNHNLENMAYPLGFRATLGGFLVGCVELGMSSF